MEFRKTNINDLPEVDKLVLADEEKVKEARKAYEALTDVQKELVPSEVINKLVAAEKKIEELRKGEVEVKPEDEDKNNQGGNSSKEDLPETGGTNTIYLYLLGIALISTGAIVVFKKKERKAYK